MKDIIKLHTVYYNRNARGVWCKMPYPGHSKGCPNVNKCIEKRTDFKKYPDNIQWYAVIEKFDLGQHIDKMKEKHPNWTQRQCRNVLYWQNSVRKKLRIKTYDFANSNKFGHTVALLDIPEASGVDVIKTMKEHELQLEIIRPINIHKIMFVGKKEE